MQPLHYLAIDLGTAFFKGAVVDVDSMTLTNVVRQPTPSPLPVESPLCYELDSQTILQTTRDLLTELRASVDHCEGILICGQMGGLVLTERNGQPLSNYHSWLDRRLLAEHPSHEGTWFDAFTQAVGEGAAERMGNEFRPGTALSLLYWLQKQDSLPKSEFYPVTLLEFVTAGLCETTPVMEWTSATGFLDVTTRDFPHDWLDDWNLSNILLPELVDFRHRVGQCHLNGQALPVYAAVGDHQCSLAGTQLTCGELSLNISTGSQVSQIVTAGVSDGSQLRPYFDGQWLRTITNIPAGRALNALMKLLTELSPDDADPNAAWAYFFTQAEALEESDVEMNLAFFPGAISGPGGIGNLREDNLTVGHVARAALQQMAVQYEQLATRLCPQRDWQRIAFSGGLAQKSSVLRQLILDRLGESHRLTDSTEDALLGLMVLGRVISGQADTLADAIAQWNELRSRNE